MKRPKFIPSEAYNLFLTRLRLARMEAGVSQRELARRLKWHWSRVIRSENGQRPLDIVETRAIVQALGLGVVDFTTELEAALSAMEAEAANSAGVDTPASDDNDSTASTTLPSPLP